MRIIRGASSSVSQAAPQAPAVMAPRVLLSAPKIRAPKAQSNERRRAEAERALAPIAADDLPLASAAADVLINNDMGFAVKPSPKLYPHQWNWDSAFIAMGLSTFDPQRAQREVLQLLEAQWDNGMIPHIVFNPEAKTYFPGPETWQSGRSKNAPLDAQGRPRATSGHSQPPVLASASRKIFERSTDRAAALKFLREAYPRLKRVQDFFYQERDRDGDGLIYTVHPWETGRDNAPEWLALMEKIQPEWEPKYQRKDDKLVDPSERPTKAEYDRFIYLVELFRSVDYDSKAILEKSPFLAQDVLLCSLVQRSNEDLLWAARELKKHTRSPDKVRELNRDIRTIEARIAKTAAGFSAKLWDEERGIFKSWDLRGGRRIESETVAAFMPLWAGLATPEQARRLVEEHLTNPDEFWTDHPVPSTSRREKDRFDPKKYWLGPTWVNTNWMIIRGLERYGYIELARKLSDKTIALLREQGFGEYFHTENGKACGGDQFSWSAALLLDLLHDPPGK